MATDPGGAEGLLIPLQFSLEEARATLAQLEAEARKRGVSVGEGFGAGAKTGLGGLLKTMQEYRSEQVQQGRQARFFASELMSIVPGASAASGALQGVLGVMIEGAAGGLSFGLALEAVKLGVGFVTSAMEESKRIHDSLATAQAALGQSLLTGRKVWQDYGQTVSDGTKLARAAVDAMLPGLEAVHTHYETVVKEGLSSWEVFWDGTAVAQKKYSARLAEAVELQKEWGRQAQRNRDLALAIVVDDQRLAADRRANAILGEMAAKNAEAAKEAAKKRAEIMAQAYSEAWQREIDYAGKRTALLGQLEEVGLDERQKVELEYERTMAGIRDGDTESVAAAMVIRNAKLAAIDKAQYEERLALVAEFRAEIVAGDEELKQKQEAIQLEYQNFMRTSFEGLVTSALAAFKPILTQSAAYSRAMRESGNATKASADLSAAAFAAMTQDFLANLALQAASKAIFEIAEGYAALGNPATMALAPFHFTAASNYGIVAGIAAAGAMVIGATRGTTRAERESISSQSSTSGATSSGGAREYYSGSSGVSGSPVTVKETVFIVAGSEFESPSETARRAARTLELVKKLDLERRAG